MRNPHDNFRKSFSSKASYDAGFDVEFPATSAKDVRLQNGSVVPIGNMTPGASLKSSLYASSHNFRVGETFTDLQTGMTLKVKSKDSSPVAYDGSSPVTTYQFTTNLSEKEL